MKKSIISLLLVVAMVCFQSCATIFGGPVSNCQRIKPVAGEPQREVRVVALLADIIIFWPSVIIDFATSAIYRPCNTNIPPPPPPKKW